MQRILHIIVFIAISVTAVQGQSVEELVRRAVLKYSEKDFRAAASDIDEAVQMKKGENDERAWHIRGFVYKDIYKEEGKNRDSEAREVAVFSLMRSAELDEEGVLKDNNFGALEVMAALYYNDASDIIEERKPEEFPKAEKFFGKYKEIIAFMYPDSSLQEKDILMNLALATAHRKIYEGDRENNGAHYNISNDYYTKVLEIDPDNWPALYSVAVAHYNKGAYNLERLPEMEIYDVIKTEGESIRSIQSALPFMSRAYEVNPERIEAVKGLKYIHFNLHDMEKHEYFDKKLEEMEKEQDK